MLHYFINDKIDVQSEIKSKRINFQPFTFTLTDQQTIGVIMITSIRFVTENSLDKFLKWV